MTVAYRSSASANSGSAAAASLTINAPAGLQNGDVMIANIVVDGGSGDTITPPAGWNLIVRLNQSTNLAQATYWKAASNEGTTYQWTNTSKFIAGNIAAYTGVDNNNPIAGSSTKATLSTTTAVAFTSLNPQAESVYVVLCVGTRNTTAARTIATPSTGYITKQDTSTTATTFIQAGIMDTHPPSSLPLAVIAPGNATMSTSVLAENATMIGLRADISQVSQLAIDVSTFKTSTSGTTLATDAFSTGYANELLIAVIGISGAGATVTSVTTSGVTWVKINGIYAGGVSSNTRIEIWRAFATSALSNVTVSVVSSTTTALVHLYTLTNTDTSGSNGAGAIGATGTTTTSPANPSVAVTTTRNSSLVVSGYTDSTNHAPTAGKNQTISISDVDGTNFAAWWSQRVNNSDNVAGSVITSNATVNAGADTIAEIAVEILINTANIVANSSLNLNRGVRPRPFAPGLAR